MVSPYIIGITGGSGSGKTSFTRKLVEHLSPHISVLSLDNYYYPIDRQPIDENGKPNFDEPESLDLEKFKTDFLKLIAGETLVLQEYTFNNPALVSKQISIQPAKIIVIEGLYAFHVQAVAEKINLKIFFDLNEKEKVRRRLKRDAEERGYSREVVLYCHKHHVQPAFLKHVAKHKLDADMVIPNNPNYEKVLGILTFYLRSLV